MDYCIVDFGIDRHRRGLLRRNVYSWGLQAHLVENGRRTLLFLRTERFVTFKQAVSGHAAAVRDLNRRFPGASWETVDDPTNGA